MFMPDIYDLMDDMRKVLPRHASLFLVAIAHGYKPEERTEKLEGPWFGEDPAMLPKPPANLPRAKGIPLSQAPARIQEIAKLMGATA